MHILKSLILTGMAPEVVDCEESPWEQVQQVVEIVGYAPASW
jgi:hypothetical protein